MTELFEAADIAGFFTNVSTMLIAFVGVALLFTAYKFVKRVLTGGSGSSLSQDDKDWIERHN